MKRVQWLEAAEDELLNEIGYLELQASGLGRRFFAEVARVEALIVEFPEAAAEILVVRVPRKMLVSAAEFDVIAAGVEAVAARR